MIGVITAISLGTSAFAKPGYRVELERTEKTTAPLTTILERDIYRTETYQAEYTVQVPYQEEEVYYEEVPYEELETYIDYEDYWDREYICRNHRTYEEKCETKRRCEPKYERRCEKKRVCQVVVPGFLQALGLILASDSAVAQEVNRDRDRERREREDRERREKEKREREERDRREREKREREERDRREREKREREERERREREERERRCWKEECKNVKVGETCRNDRECKKVPKDVRKCEWEQVRKTRPVTKTRWVTRYRTERRTRWVTRYRDEVRCCITKDRQVFDRTIRARVELQFPPEAILTQGERESFVVELNEVSGHSDISVHAKNAIYSYQPLIQKVSEEEFLVQMRLAPTYDAAELGEQTISPMKLVLRAGGLQLSFEDKGIVPKTRTDYVVRLLDPNTRQELVALTVLEQKQPSVAIDMGLALPVGRPVIVVLDVRRNGIVISTPVAFVKEEVVQVAPEPYYDAKPYMDPNQVGKFSLGGNRAGLIIYFRDLTKNIPEVRTEYHYRVSLNGRVLAENVFHRADLVVGADGRIPLSAVEAFGVSPADLNLLKPGTVIMIDGQVIRYGTRFPNGRYAIPKKVTLQIK